MKLQMGIWLIWPLAVTLAACGSAESASMLSWDGRPSGSSRWAEHIVVAQSTTMTAPGVEPERIVERNATIECVIVERAGGRSISFSEFSIDGTNVHSRVVPGRLEVEDDLVWADGEPSPEVAEIAAILFDPRNATVDDADASYTTPHASGAEWSVPALRATAALASRNCANTPAPADARAAILGPSRSHADHLEIATHLEFTCELREPPPGPFRARLLWTHERTVPTGSGSPVEDLSTIAIETTLIGGRPGEDALVVAATSVRRSRGEPVP